MEIHDRCICEKYYGNNWERSLPPEEFNLDGNFYGSESFYELDNFSDLKSRKRSK
jgi:hypothetical protein